MGVEVEHHADESVDRALLLVVVQRRHARLDQSAEGLDRARRRASFRAAAGADAEVEAFQEAEFGVTRADLNWLEDLSQNPGAPSGRPVRDFTNEQLDQLEMKVEQVEAEEFVVPEAMVNVPAGSPSADAVVCANRSFHR